MEPTQEQIDRYEEEVKSHEEYIKNYRHFLEKIVNHMKWHDKRYSMTHTWTPDDILDFFTKEIDQAESMDAPNRPGYFRANND